MSTAVARPLPASLTARLSRLFSRHGSQPEPSRRPLYSALWKQARSCRRHLALLLAANLLATPLSLLYPWALKIAVDSGLGSLPLPGWLAWMLPEPLAGTSTGALVLAVLLLLLVGSLIHVQILAVWYLQTYVAQRLTLDFRSRLFQHVQRLSLAFHSERPTTDTVYRIQQDASSMQFIFVQGLIPLVAAVFGFTAMVYVTARIDWQLAALALAISPVLYLLSRACTRRVRRRWHEVKDYDSSAMSGIQETMALLRVVKAFGQERRSHSRYVNIAQKHMEGQLWLAFVQGGFHMLVGVTLSIGAAVALYVGVSHVRAGMLTLGELLIVMTYLTHLYGPLNTISTKIPDTQEWLASVERAFALLQTVPEGEQAGAAIVGGRARGEVEFRDVSFAYGERPPVLDAVSFRVAAGTRIGIIGRTGAGKSTLVSLLTRFYEPTAGQVLLDGVDIREYTLEELRRQYSIVLQEPVLFSTTVAENIAYARPDATMDEIVAAARSANAHEFILRLPQGYGTPVGERGARLSGGERQRISLARAFLKDSPVLLLDEPTSSVDMETEAAIMQATEALMQGRTTFMIAHRLSTLRGSDHILVLHRGKLLGVAQDVDGAMSLLTAEAPAETSRLDDVADAAVLAAAGRN